jgi:hypothetical protein
MYATNVLSPYFISRAFTVIHNTDTLAAMRKECSKIINGSLRALFISLRQSWILIPLIRDGDTLRRCYELPKLRAADYAEAPGQARGLHIPQIY